MQKLELQSSAATDRLSRSAYCEKHGEYVEAGRKVFGHVVWFGCAKCQEEERKHQEMLQKLEEARGGCVYIFVSSAGLRLSLLAR